MIDVYKIVKDINARYRAEKKAPPYAPLLVVLGEVTRQAREEMRRLVVAKRLRYFEALNSFSFEALDEEDGKKEE